jgi:hypothetical protein
MSVFFWSCLFQHRLISPAIHIHTAVSPARHWLATALHCQRALLSFWNVDFRAQSGTTELRKPTGPAPPS